MTKLLKTMTMMKIARKSNHLLKGKQQQQQQQRQQRKRLQLTMLSRITAILQCLLCLLLCMFAAGVTETRPYGLHHRARPIAATLQKGGAGVTITREEWSTTRRRILAQNDQTQGSKKKKKKKSTEDDSKSCEIILDNYFGTEGLDRQACSSCEKHPSLDKVYVLTCAFVDVCDGPFCATEDLGPYTCYERQDTYYVQTDDFKFFQDLGFAGCGHYTAVNEVVCLEEFYEAGYLLGRCMAVNGEPCTCNVNSKCGEYEFSCDNGAFVLDECIEDAYGTIEVGSVYTALNYQPYQESEAQCFSSGGTIYPSWEILLSASPSPTSKGKGEGKYSPGTENPPEPSALLSAAPAVPTSASPSQLPSKKDFPPVPSTEGPPDSEMTHSPSQLPPKKDSASVPSDSPALQASLPTNSPSMLQSEVETLPKGPVDSETTPAPSQPSSMKDSPSDPTDYPSPLPSAIEFQSEDSSPQGPVDSEVTQDKSSQKCNGFGCLNLFPQDPGAEEVESILWSSSQDKGTDASLVEPILEVMNATSFPSTSKPSPTPTNGCTGFGCSNLHPSPTGFPVIGPTSVPTMGGSKELESGFQDTGTEPTAELTPEVLEATGAPSADTRPSDMPSASPSVSFRTSEPTSVANLVTLTPTGVITETPTRSTSNDGRLFMTYVPTNVPTPPIPSGDECTGIGCQNLQSFFPSDLPSSQPSASAVSDLPSVSLLIQSTVAPTTTKTTTDPNADIEKQCVGFGCRPPTPAEGCTVSGCQGAGTEKLDVEEPALPTSVPAVKSECSEDGCRTVQPSDALETLPSTPQTTSPQPVGCTGVDCSRPPEVIATSPSANVTEEPISKQHTAMPSGLKSVECNEDGCKALPGENITLPPVIAFEATPLEDFSIAFLMETTIDDDTVLGATKLYLYEFISSQFDNLRAIDLTIEESTTDTSRHLLERTRRMLHFHGFAIFNGQLPLQSEVLEIQIAALSDTKAVEEAIDSRINGTVSVIAVDYSDPQSLASDTTSATTAETGRMSISVLIFIATTALLLI